MDPKILELRRMQAAKYAKVPKDEKPHIRECTDCGKPVYDSKVCMTTGRFHNLDKYNIVGGKVVDSDVKFMSGKELVAAIDGVRIKWQKARVEKVEVDSDSATIFQTFVLQRQWKHQRVGIMYGKFDESTKVVSVHAVYEPEQVGSETTFDVLPDAREVKVDKMAALLGLKRVGLIITHPPRNSDEIILAGKELMLLAREQSRFGDHCVLVAVSPNPQTQQINAQAWQATEQCVRLYQIGLLSEHPNDIRFCKSSQPLELAQDDKDQKGHPQCIIRDPSHSVDCRWMTGYTAVAPFQSFLGNKFVRISRPGEAPPTFANLKSFFAAPHRKTQNFVQKISDFHALIFLMEFLFDLRTEMPLVCDAVIRQDNLAVSTLEELVKAHMDAGHR